MSDLTYPGRVVLEEYLRQLESGERVRVSLDESLRLLRPPLDGVPLPGGAPADEPVGVRDDVTPLPLVDGGPGDTEPVGDVGEADDGGVGWGCGPAGHAPDRRTFIDGRLVGVPLKLLTRLRDAEWDSTVGSPFDEAVQALIRLIPEEPTDGA